MPAELTTLCYLERDGRYLMLHRVSKKHDVNKDKWIGVGGHCEENESPEDCLLREVREETGYTLTDYRMRGVVTFLSGKGDYEYMFLYTASGWTGEAAPCDEGKLEWVDKEKVWKLNIWEGDKIFFRLMDEDAPFFSLKLVYDGTDRLVQAVLNGKDMELFDIADENGKPTGRVTERGVTIRCICGSCGRTPRAKKCRMKYFCRKGAATRTQTPERMTSLRQDICRRAPVSWSRPSVKSGKSLESEQKQTTLSISVNIPALLKRFITESRSGTARSPRSFCIRNR